MNPEKRVSAKPVFLKVEAKSFAGMSQKLIVILVFVLMALPLFTTFNEILTKIAEKSGFYNYLSQNVVPFETRAVSIILKPLGIDSSPTISELFIQRKDGTKTGILFSWNCLGWQSAILLIFTLILGLSGKQYWENKLETLLLGISGTFLINLLRITIVVLVAYYLGQTPAAVIHDYGGTLFTVGWFFFYWWFSYKYILDPQSLS